MTTHASGKVNEEAKLEQKCEKCGEFIPFSEVRWLWGMDDRMHGFCERCTKEILKEVKE